MPATPRPVALFVTCLVDLFRPAIAEASVRLLERAGCTVRVPAQTCCGQPCSSAGDEEGARECARGMLRAFAGYPHVVAPSASCVATVKGFPALFATGTAERATAEDLAGRCQELTVFLRDVAGFAAEPAAWAVVAAWHESCSALRGPGMGGSAGRALLGQVPGCSLRELAEPESCCGFGGSFALKYPEVSARIADQKLDDLVATGARCLVGGDLGCLLHLQGRAQRRGLDVEVRHVAEVLAREGDAGDGR